jgi:PAS domain-containing protein
MDPHLSQRVTATRLVRDLAAIRSMAAQSPVAITSHRRTELVLLSAEHFAAMGSAANESDARHLDARLDAALDAIDTRVVIVDDDLRVRRVNRAMRLALGLADKPYEGENVFDLLPREVAPFIAKRLSEVYESGKLAEFDFPSTLNPGRTIHARIVPWPGGIAYFSEDITDRLRAIERDMEFAALREAFAALGGHGSGSVSADGLIRHADSGLGALVGADHDNLIGRRLITLFDPSDHEPILAAMRQRGGLQVLEVGYLRNGVTLGRARLVLSSYFAGDGQPLYAFAIADAGFVE